MNKYFFLPIALITLFFGQPIFCMERDQNLGVSKDQSAEILNLIAEARAKGAAYKVQAELARKEELKAIAHFGHLAGKLRQERPVPVGPSHMQKSADCSNRTTSLQSKWRTLAIECTIGGTIFVIGYLVGAKFVKKVLK